MTTLVILLFAVLAFANTEVVKYAVSNSFPPLPFASPDPQWPVLSQSQPDLKLNITPAPLASACKAVDEQCQHHLWTALNMTGPRWSSHSSYMLRVSWPATVCAFFFKFIAKFDTAIYLVSDYFHDRRLFVLQ
jgi:hypothetical protein